MSILIPSFRLNGEDFDGEVYNLLFEQVADLEHRLEFAFNINP